MKKMIYMIAFAAVLGFAPTAQAIVNNAQLVDRIDTSWQNPGTQTTIGGGTNVINKLRCAPGFSYSPARYDSNGNEICVGSSTIDRPVLNPDFPVVNPDPVLPRDPIIFDPVSPVVTTATVSSCPSGMTKSSDGCCCVNN